MAKLNCVLVGDESLLVQCAEMLRTRGHSIAAVVTAHPAIREWAKATTIKVAGWGSDLEAQLIGEDYDWLFSVANLRMIPEPVWRKAKIGAANFHDGALPRSAGLNTPSWSIIEGEETHGVTWHALTAGIDEGDIYSRQSFEVSPDETAFTLNTKCFEAGIATFEEMLDGIERNKLAPERQDFAERRYFGKNLRPEAAATLRFDRSAEELSRLVRGLDFGAGYSNPLVTAKLRAGDDLYVVTHLEILDEESSSKPGAVISAVGNGAVIATADRPVLIRGVLRRGGTEISLSSVLRAGTALPLMSEADGRALSAAVADIVRHEDAFKRDLAAATDLDLGDVKSSDPALAPDILSLPLNVPDRVGGSARMALVAAFLSRLTGQSDFTLAYSDAELGALASRFAGYFAASVPLNVNVDRQASASDFSKSFEVNIESLRKRKTYLKDLPERFPNISEPRLSFGIVEAPDLSRAIPIDGCALTFVFGPGNDEAAAFYDRNRLGEHHVADLLSRLDIFSAAFASQSGPVADLPLMSSDEENRVLYDWNHSERAYERDVCVHVLVERQVDLTPDAVAITFRDQSLTYRQMDERANMIADALVTVGVGPDVLVGLHLRRSLDLVVGALAIQKAGGAYVPLDPDFPADRVSLMVEDSGVGIVLTDRSLAGSRSVAGAMTLCIEDVLQQQLPCTRAASRVSSSNLAYVIYTSGSTGRPKGVMVEHHNVVNFFAGMDERIPIEPGAQPVWLAVTSLSFDISVLELFWTLARGFKVVVHASEVHHAAVSHTNSARGRPLDFGLFYWGNDDGAGPAKYRLLLEGAKFADDHGFQSLWTPERHFHAFGGPYPNPAVTGAAVAAVTKNLSIRAGSCVLPLHHPARVAEEWAVIDNISNGRVALAFASGWMPEDFLLRPENAPPNNKASMIRDIETVRKLWRGETVEFDFGKGKVGVVTQPRPVQQELPIWLTTAGNPETYREAARLGANVLTHLLGQSIDEVADKVRIYRETLVEVGRNPADHTVTLMLHTLLGEDREEVRNQAREPMKDYLRSAAALIKQYAWAFPAFKKPQGVSQPMDIDLQSLEADELDAILEFAFLRYFEDSGLFGTVEDALRRLDQVAAAGIDEIACLIDFGVPSSVVLDRLNPLARVVMQIRGSATLGTEMKKQSGIAAEIGQHKITHLQCTPSMASMFLMGKEDRQALRDVKHLFIGGEALQGALLAELGEVTSASIENMYGPTETTIWSSTRTAQKTDGVVPLGRPIANTQFYVLDPGQRPVPPGVPGELYIGGDGVTRGYLNREDLTTERFLPNPFMQGRIYRTGDLVRFGNDGTLHFLGRADHQVKVRGYRIELGEIEVRIGKFPGVREVVVVAREDRVNDVRIVAYLHTPGAIVSEEELRKHISEALPDYMVPAHFVTLDAFPLTPNAKVDRKKLPKPEDGRKLSAKQNYVAPSDNLQREIAETFRRALGIERVGLLDSFFALGGHSLLAVQVHRELKAGIAPELTITDLFRFPTVSGLATHIADRGKANERLSQVAGRAALRRSALGLRLAALTRARDNG